MCKVLRASKMVLAIGLIAILGAIGGAQRRDRSADAMAFWERQSALHNGLLDTFAGCADRPRRPDEGLNCEIFKEEVRQIGLDIFLTPKLATKLKGKISASDIEDLKSAISLHMVNAYYHGKAKAETRR